MKEKLAAVGAVLSASLASICCLGPLVLAGLGLGGLGLAAGLTKYRPLFLGITAVLLGVALFLTYRRREVRCADGSCKAQSGSHRMKVLLWTITAGVIILATFPHYAGVLAGSSAETARVTGEKVTLNVSGMTCAACATGIEKALRKVPGVRAASVSLENSQALIITEPGKVIPETLMKAVESAGPYKAQPVGAGERSGPMNLATVRPALPRAGVAPDRVTFYEVNLVCPAAPQIGCGSRAKAVLRVLASDSDVTGGWLNEAGTRMAVAWKKGPLSPERLTALLTKTGVDLREVTDQSREALLESFRSSVGWYDVDSVDRLSEQEAGIIAARLVKRLTRRVGVTPAQRTRLLSAIEKELRDCITKEDVCNTEERLLNAAKPSLNATALAVFKDVLALGLRPLSTEE